MENLLKGLKAAAESTRIRILLLCQESSLTVSDLTQILRQGQPNLSRHLKLMVAGGLLERNREGSFAYYNVAKRGEAAELAATLCRLCPIDDAVLQRDRLQLQQIKANRAAQAEAYFRKNAESWEEIREIHSNNRAIEQKIIDLVHEQMQILPRTDKNGQILPQKIPYHIDLGTGGGRMLEVLAPYCLHQIGIDQSREMLAVARAKLDPPQFRHITLRQADLYDVPIEAGAADLITLHHVLHYLDAPKRALSEAARLLASNGVLVIADFIAHERQELRDEHSHLWLGFAHTEITAMCQAVGLSPPRHFVIAKQDRNGLDVAIWVAQLK
ncbi:MAG: metalloregulator ArsR/SmtB family transcription factor [Alphaproteobacteria bacterium]|nr:metalloregulator ArsR/SmtB family transcription factor [Alphaproteobacteria bacterium]